MSMADQMRLEAEVYTPIRVKKNTEKMAKVHLNEILSGIRFAAHNGKFSYFYNLGHVMMLPLPPKRMEMLWKIDTELRKRGFELAYRNAERNEDGIPKEGSDTDGPTDRTLCVTVSWGNGNFMRAQRTNAIKYWLLNAIGIGAALFGIFYIALLIRCAAS